VFASPEVRKEKEEIARFLYFGFFSVSPWMQMSDEVFVPEN
jgi:hypothetical protein